MNNLAVDLQPTWLERFIDIYQHMSKDKLHLLGEIYHNDIAFEDPLHKIEGLTNLSAYFENLYENLISCKFNVHQVMINDNRAAIYWQMAFSHKRLNGGETVVVEGHSLLYSQQGKVIFHRDYFDAGSMVYEQIPLLRNIIGFLKKRLA